MKKRIPALLLALCACCLLSPPWAAQDTPDNFVRSKTYAGQFSDLTPELGVLRQCGGACMSTVSPWARPTAPSACRTTMTVGQVVIFAGRIRSLYRTGDAEAGASRLCRRE